VQNSDVRAAHSGTYGPSGPPRQSRPRQHEYGAANFVPIAAIASLSLALRGRSISLAAVAGPVLLPVGARTATEGSDD
jgi:hypothetical protein